jgi:hypothetical protein
MQDYCNSMSIELIAVQLYVGSPGRFKSSCPAIFQAHQSNEIIAAFAAAFRSLTHISLRKWRFFHPVAGPQGLAQAIVEVRGGSLLRRFRRTGNGC